MQHHLSDDHLLSLWGDCRTMPALLLQRRLEWLGHVACMPDDRIPKVLLMASYLHVARLVAPGSAGVTVLQQI